MLLRAKSRGLWDGDVGKGDGGSAVVQCFFSWLGFFWLDILWLCVCVFVCLLVLRVSILSGLLLLWVGWEYDDDEIVFDSNSSCCCSV